MRNEKAIEMALAAPQKTRPAEPKRPPFPVRVKGARP